MSLRQQHSFAVCGQQPMLSATAETFCTSLCSGWLNPLLFWGQCGQNTNPWDLSVLQSRACLPHKWVCCALQSLRGKAMFQPGLQLTLFSPKPCYLFFCTCMCTSMCACIDVLVCACVQRVPVYMCECTHMCVLICVHMSTSMCVHVRVGECRRASTMRHVPEHGLPASPHLPLPSLGVHACRCEDSWPESLWACSGLSYLSGARDACYHLKVSLGLWGCKLRSFA